MNLTVLVKILALIFAFTSMHLRAQQISDPYLVINAEASDPLYTTYAASMSRSQLYGDKAYKMDYYSTCNPLTFTSDQAGKLYQVWRFNSVVVDRMATYHKKPVVVASFPDMAILSYEPWPGIVVTQTFFVYSSEVAWSQLKIENRSGKAQVVDFYPVLEIPEDSLRITGFDAKNNSYLLYRNESRKRLISNLSSKYPYPVEWTDLLAAGFDPYSHGAYSGSLDDLYTNIKRDFYAEVNRHDSLNCADTGYFGMALLHSHFTLKPGETRQLSYFRATSGDVNAAEKLKETVNGLKNIDIQPFIDANVALFTKVPRIEFKSKAEKIMYLGALNLARGCMLPPEGATSHNYYVFSRNPLWGWGHGHQVLHESLSMLAYTYLDPVSAMESQRVYMEQQRPDGFIAYRHGPRGVQDYPHKGMPTTSSPFFSWTNLEVFKTSRDTNFLRQAYESGCKYTGWLVKNRDQDGDGLFEWGPYGIIENVRDWYNAVFQVSADRYLDVDKEDISDELECLDLTLMIIKEMKSLSEMAADLGKKDESLMWRSKADNAAIRVNNVMWDEKTGFYYHVNRADHSFRFMERDLKRQEIIAFLALWAGVAPPERAARLVTALTDTTRFWRKYGVPTLAADDVWYSPYVDYCCKWNGPVWMLWDYLVYDGLKQYGYNKEAAELAGKMLLAAQTQLSVNHNFWESYSPDNEVLNCPPNYIWDAIIAKLLIEEYKPK